VRTNLVLAFVILAAVPVIAFQARVSPPGYIPAPPKLGDSKMNPKDGLTYLWIPPGNYPSGCSPNDKQ
jgi:hypothetical protein